MEKDKHISTSDLARILGITRQAIQKQLKDASGVKIKKVGAGFLKELVKMIRRDLTIDWTNSEIVKARIRDNAKLLLLRNDFKPEETEEITNLIYQQAFYLYRDYAFAPTLSTT